MKIQEETGRVAQKKKTKRALLDAAQNLLEAGFFPSVTNTAMWAGISRATAYRYFSTPEALAQAAVTDRIAAEIGGASFSMEKDAEPEQAAAEAVSLLLAVVMRNEALFRTYLSLMARSDAAASGGDGRVAWLAEALAPLSGGLPKAKFDRLVNALSVLAGVEALVVLKDVCGLSPEPADEVARWTASALVRAALDE